MKKIILVTFIFFIQSIQISAYEPKLQKVVDGLDGPWSLSFINDYTVLVTEKSGDIILIDINKKKNQRYKTQSKYSRGRSRRFTRGALFWGSSVRFIFRKS